MKPSRTLPPTRLGKTGATGEPGAQGYADLARLLSTAPTTPPLDGFAVARVERRLYDSLATKSLRRRARWVPAVTVAAALVFGGGLIATGATVVAHRGWSLRQLLSALSWPAQRPTSASHVTPNARASGLARVARRPPTEPELGQSAAALGDSPEQAPVFEAAPVVPATNLPVSPSCTPTASSVAPLAARTPGRSRPLRPTSAQPPAVLPSSLSSSSHLPVSTSHGPPGGELARSEEVRLFARAVASLRREGRAGASITLCDEYLRRFPNGVLGDEVEAVRAEAELRAGDHGAALAGLGRLTLRDDERGLALRLARAELRAETSCSAALADFDRVLAADANAALTERALYGRSACRARSRDEIGAKADARAYLKRFPNGPRAVVLRDRAGL
jgi:hypothetical protein